MRLPEYFFQLAAAGEMTGKLAESLDEAVAQYAYQQEVAGDLRNALIYPAVLVGSGILGVGVMFAFVVPRFAGMLQDAAQLPWLAWAVLSAGSFLNRNLLTCLLLVAALVAGVVYALRRPGVRAALLDRLAHWPVLGPWLTESETTSWAALLGALLGQGVPMLDSLALANRGVRLASRRRRLEAAARAVKAGLSLSKALEEQGAFDATAYNLLRTGERAGPIARHAQGTGGAERQEQSQPDEARTAADRATVDPADRHRHRHYRDRHRARHYQRVRHPALV
ncbi:MAG: type II secretion system F family protein [Gammaproteobacteria bacterium]|nr:type II secretion system F family protein [Gammaproteobacteria bacterium]